MNAEHYDYKRLQELREQSGLSQEEVAAKLKKSRPTIQRAETGKVASYGLLCLLAQEYGVPVVSILKPVVKVAA